jgi:molybdopterin molybdotransferase
VTLVPLAEARRHVLERCGVLGAQVVSTTRAHGLVLAEAVMATESVPPFDNTAMDGFAVRAADTRGASPEAPVRLRVVDTVAAGRATPVPVAAGEAIRIMTGAPMPAGADAVVMVERTRAARGECVDVLAEVAPATHIRRAGDDLAPGEVALAAGTLLGPAALGVLAGLGVAEVTVVRRPRVGVLSTGDELVVGPGPLAPGQIRDSNRPALLAAVREAGAEVVDLGCIADEEPAIEVALRRGIAECDAVLSSGGVSMGDIDLVKVVLDRISDMRWMQVAIKPAKPFAFGVAPGPTGTGVAIFGLPGNPVSALVSFELFARPALRAMAGHPTLERPTVRATAEQALARRPDGKTHFVRVSCRADGQGRWHVRPAQGQGSHQLAAMAATDGLAVVPDGDGIAAGGDATVLLLVS